MNDCISKRRIYSTDIQAVCKVASATAYRYMMNIKRHLGKQRHQIVTNYEAAEFLGLSVSDFEEMSR
ncbi:hypothetical protein [Psychroflexus aestuariivivens]|uniref:hypothetical protein n=1 Tax=Psychroflexus aestuariivivens TaxID=1795040 RepID=UPI000FDC04EC|nr:hypothetical protein [Psychroflexus aestuariivivens]